MSVNFDDSFYLTVSSSSNSLDAEGKKLLGTAANESANETSSDQDQMDSSSIETIEYKPMSYHWFYTTNLADKLTWQAMSATDSKRLEDLYARNL